MDLVLETRDLRKHFRGLAAIDGINLAIKRKELRTILGPNGAGKTTLYNLITGHLKPTSGKVFFNGEDITGLPPHKIAEKGISRKFQIPTIFEEMSVYENLLVPTLRRGRHPAGFSEPVAEEKELAHSVLEDVNLSDKATVKAKFLSHGQKQWLEVGMAMATNPTLILLDEPTAGMTTLDVKETTAELIRTLTETTTVVVIEHDISFVRMIAKNVTVLNNGKILAEGTIDEIVQNQAVIHAYLGREQ